MNKWMRFVCVWVGVGMALQQAHGDGWPQFGGPTADFRATSDVEAAQRAVTPCRTWERTLGQGLSGIVASGDLVYVCHLDPKESPREVVCALDRVSGNTVWEDSYEAPHLESQEAFGGRKRSPQATPLIIGDKLITIGFSGWLHAFDRHSGKVAWKINLVPKFAATPVQFGFSASAIEMDGRLIVFAGGKHGGLVCIDVEDGNPLWNVPCGEASYATPVILEVDGMRQIVFVTRDEIVGVDANSGKPIWRYPLPKPGLTNVPTPLITSDGGLVVSGQGIGGTAKLQIRKAAQRWEVEQAWFSSFQFFYCNWVLHDQYVIGCDGDLLIAFDSRTGTLLGRWRGFGSANLCLQGDRLLAIDGDGVLSTIRIRNDELEVETRHRFWEERVWTPPTLVGRQLLSRAGGRVACVDLHGMESGEPLESVRISRSRLVMTGKTHTRQAPMDPIAEITRAFRDGGVAAASKAYESAREARSLTVDDHHLLAEMALDEGLTDMASKIVKDAMEDFSETESLDETQAVISRRTRTPSSKIDRRDNGLDYIELGVRNNTRSMLQTQVEGPAKHPFGYGIPFPPGKLRIERWPVGTKLYRTEGDVRLEVLMEVAREDAGQTIALKPNRAPGQSD